MTDYVVKLDTKIINASRDLGYPTPKSFIVDAAKLLQFVVDSLGVVPNDSLEPLEVQLQNVVNNAHDEGYDQSYDDNDSYDEGYDQGYDEGLLAAIDEHESD